MLSCWKTLREWGFGWDTSHLYEDLVKTIQDVTKFVSRNLKGDFWGQNKHFSNPESIPSPKGSLGVLARKQFFQFSYRLFRLVQKMASCFRLINYLNLHPEFWVHISIGTVFTQFLKTLKPATLKNLNEDFTILFIFEFCWFFWSFL
jgi:hypothetical protein